MIRTRPVLTAAALVALAAPLLASCGEQTTSSGEGTPPAAVDRSPGEAAPTGAVRSRPCPRRLGGPAEGSPDTATAPVVLPAADAAWVCRFDLDKGRPGPDGSTQGADGAGWTRAGRPVAVDPAAYDGLELTPAPADRMCTMDIGPRWLLVVAAADGDLQGVAVDAYGCRDVRVADDPRSGTTSSGALVGPDDLLEQLVAAWEAGRSRR